MKKFIIFVIIFLSIGIGYRWYVQQKSAEATLGTDMTYTLATNGDALVEQANKVYFTTPDAEANFRNLEQRGAPLRTDATAKTMSDVLKNLSDQAGRPMTATDFAARLDRTGEYGAQVVAFRWTGFAAQSGDTWLIDYSFADKIVLNEHSNLIIVLPDGAKLLSADPAPMEQQGARLLWRGPGTLPWPRVEYRLPKP